MNDFAIVNLTMAALRSKGLASEDNDSADIPKLVYQIPVGGTADGDFNKAQLKVFLNTEAQMAYVYYGNEVVASFDVSDPNNTYDPFKFVSGRRVIQMPVIGKTPTLATSSAGTVEYRALTNNLSVDANGYITATAVGLGCVECSVEYSGKRYVFTCLVDVIANAEIQVEPKRANEPTAIFFINYPQDCKMRVGDYNPITAYVWPNNILTDDNLCRITSDNLSVLHCEYGILHAVGEGTATLTASPLGYPGITESITITVEAARPEPENVYTATAGETTSNGVLHNDGTEPLETAKAINDLIQYAVDNGYDGITFPMGTYAVTLDDSVTYSKRPAIINITQSNLCIDFQGATIAGQINSRTYVADGEGAYHSSGGQSLIRFYRAENVTLRNAVVKGTKGMDHEEGKTKSWWDVLVHSDSSVDCECVNVEMCESLSWGVCIAEEAYPTIALWADEFQVGGYTDQGVYDETLEGICTVIKPKSENSWNYWDDSYPRYNLGSDIWANGDYPYISSRMYNILWFDENQDFISIGKNKHQHYSYRDKPDNARYFAVHFTNPVLPGLPTGSGGSGGVHEDGNRSYVCALNCNRKSEGFTVRNCHIHDNGTMGGASIGGWNCRLIDCTFSANGGWDNDWDFDIEDGGLKTNILLVGCIFNGYGLVTATPNTDLVLLNNIFNGGYTRFHALSQYPRIVANSFLNGCNPSVGCQTSGVFSDNTYDTKKTKASLTGSKLHSDAVYEIVGDNNYNLVIEEASE